MGSKSNSSSFSKSYSLVIASISTCLVLACGFLGLGEGVLGSVPGQPDVSNSLQEILNKTHQGPLYTYPTSLTQGIVPVSFAVSLIKLYIS
jgi:hypothetical protein